MAPLGFSSEDNYMQEGLADAHRQLKEAQAAMALFTARTKGKTLTDEEAAEQLRLRRNEFEATENLYRAEHGEEKP